MAFYIDLFSPETYSAFSDSDRDVSGFRERQQGIASLINPGDKLICYMTKLSRWIGILEVTSSLFIDQTPIFMKPIDPFIVRFKVKPYVWLSPEESVPIIHDICWKHLSFTKQLPKKSQAWTGMVRSSLKKLEDEDGAYLEKILFEQRQTPKKYNLSEADYRKLKPPVVHTTERQVVVSIPDDERNSPESIKQRKKKRHESIQMQAKLAEIGERIDMKIWLPRNDKQRVLEIWHPQTPFSVLDKLPFDYGDVTMRTIENIDVLWVRKRSIVRAFEVEHTTSIYSGILRMADLMALQPNLSIKAHIVAPIARREKFLKEITRPVFALLGSHPLSESCSYLSYDSINELLENRFLEHMRDDVLETFAEYAEDADI